jgi:hypothetical protein
MELVSKNIDSRGYVKNLVSRSVKAPLLRLAKLRDKIRRKYLLARIREKYSRETQKSLDDQYYGEFCGKFGIVETDQDGSKRYHPFFCNLRRMCFECLNRFKRGVLLENETRILAVAQANHVRTIVTPVYTLHSELRCYLTTCDKSEKPALLNEVNNLAVESFKQAIGLGGRRGRDVTGIISVIHPFGSKNPFQPFLHFHLIWLPLMITQDGKVRQMQYFVDVNKARDLWHDAQMRFAKEHGFSLSSPTTNVKFSFIFLDMERKLKHSLRYIFRSLIDDIFIAIQYFTDDLERFVWFEDLDSDWGLHVDKWDAFADALEKYMNFPVKMVRSYGFFRNLPKHSKVLNIMRVEDKDDFVPVTTSSCEFRRVYRKHYLKGIKKWIFRVSIQVKHDGFAWHNIPRELVVGETCSLRVKKRWIRAP